MLPASKPKRRGPVYAHVSKLWLLIIIGGLLATGAWAQFLHRPQHAKTTTEPLGIADPTAVIAKPVRSKLFASERDVEYCNGQLLDFYRPRRQVYAAAPTVMYIHGGGWLINNKANEPDQLARIDGLRDEGFAVVSINYRLMPEFYYPAPVEDALCAVRFLRANANKFGIDPARMGVFGFSAGGYLAAMLGVLPPEAPQNAGAYLEQPFRVKAVVTLAGLLDFDEGLWESNHIKINRFLHGHEITQADPAVYVTPDDAPFLLVHGLQDQYVPPGQDDAFAAILAKAGVLHPQIKVSNAEHGLNQTGGDMEPGRESVNGAIRTFFKTWLLQ